MLNPVNDDRDYAPIVQQFEQQGFARVPLTDAMVRKIERIYRLGEEFFVRSEAEWSLIVRGIFRAIADAWAPGSPELRCYNGTYVQLNYYEPSQHSAELLQDSHEDAHLLTLVKANAPGLEIEVDGKYVPAGADGSIPRLTCRS